ncbi:2-amino-4-hydroxy-6-hydroxymethyldihydropteridine diphosphokinase [Prolixibacter bellariivorans]|uniref:2-amino-4-hydroxy-6-hydroxymethyldihydropteridine pyrophosphokinase n=1 Tax=Prolixibacter bellariivorans TaxID=314319 RepID=A0A5M4AXS2_9BACT|nr:2-amino-4-hydroxy-6-hydroxymethyldihydropteridine diphosphokinase [Prolixibacter bellariivorans]GET32488.1 2-amino-4-hydroxy-6-hydroxymethyldihydropteridine diphosphokinase [Prolixibacter bellariivorans]
MLQVDILLGGNVGNTLEIFNKAKVQMVEKAGQIIQESSLYQTEAWGFDSDPFLNQVVTIETTLLPQGLLQKLFSIETYFGRERKGNGYSARTLDLDILFVEDQVMNEPTLIIPHPRMAERRFVLEPLNELYPNRIHPITGKTISQMVSECPDNSRVEKLS